MATFSIISVTHIIHSIVPWPRLVSHLSKSDRILWRSWPHCQGDSCNMASCSSLQMTECVSRSWPHHHGDHCNMASCPSHPTDRICVKVMATLSWWHLVLTIQVPVSMVILCPDLALSWDDWQHVAHQQRVRQQTTGLFRHLPHTLALLKLNTQQSTTHTLVLSQI